MSDWQDPFADDEAARERAARRAEREARRREREARESLGDRVREEMENREPSAPGEAEPPTQKPPASSRAIGVHAAYSGNARDPRATSSFGVARPRRTAHGRPTGWILGTACRAGAAHG